MIQGAKVTLVNGNEIKIEAKCVVTGELYSVTVPWVGYKRWTNGVLIQNAFPELSAGDREFLISGTSQKGWGILISGSDGEF